MSAPIPVAPVELAVGDALVAPALGPLTRTDFVRYAGAGGDLNPIHHDEPMAQAAGMPTVFGMGMLHAGVLGVRLARWVGPGNVRLLSVRFTGQVWPGDVLSFAGAVTALEEIDGEARARIELAVRRQDDSVVLTGVAIAAVASA